MAFLKSISRNRKKVIVMPFGGYCNDKMIHAQARVLEDEGIQHSPTDSALKNLWNSFKRLESDEKKYVTVKALWGTEEKLLVSDKEGYIFLDESHDLFLNNQETEWIPLTYQLLENEKVVYETTTAVQKPGRQTNYGIISDMDDTVLHTGVVSTFKWRVLVNSLMKHSHKRTPLEGSQIFYSKLHKGKTGHNSNPFFYLSNSPWNLYDYLYSFLENFKFPSGTLLLRDIDIKLKRKPSFMEGNKFKKVVHILETYPSMPFILVGDAGEHDADIYLKVAQLFPNQILAIYIRSVSRLANIRRIERIIEANTNIEMVLIKESETAIAHAQAKGYIL